MRCFREGNNELIEYLRSSNTHDGQFQYAMYNQITKEFSVHVENTIWNDSIDMLFIDICEFSSVADFKWGNNESINAFALITDNVHKGKLHFVFELFSGNQIHIICSELRISSKAEAS